MYNLLHTSLREKETDNWDLYKALRNLPISMREMSPERKKIPRRSNNYEWNCSIKIWWCGLGEKRETPLHVFSGMERGMGGRLFGAGNFQADTTGLLNIPLDQSHHWRAQVTIWWQLWRQETRPPGAPPGPLNTSDPVSLFCAGPRALEQRPGAQSSCITRQEKQRINHFCSRILQLATQGCRKCWAEIVHGTCRSQKAIPSPQSLLLTSKD